MQYDQFKFTKCRPTTCWAVSLGKSLDMKHLLDAEKMRPHSKESLKQDSLCHATMTQLALELLSMLSETLNFSVQKVYMMPKDLILTKILKSAVCMKGRGEFSSCSFAKFCYSLERTSFSYICDLKISNLGWSQV